MRTLLQRLDDLVAQVERFIVLFFLAVMSLAVFFDVVHRVAASPDGLILRVLKAFWPGEAPESLATVGVPLVAFLGVWGVAYAALRTRTGSTLSTAAAALQGLLWTLAVGGLVFALLKLFPNGLVWSQPLALGQLLWVALFGATLAAKSRGHIAIEAAAKLWPPAALPYTKLLSGLLAAAFSFVLMALGAHYTSDFFEQWRELGVGNVSGLPVPRWTVYLAMPVAFGLLGLRFGGYAIADFIDSRGEKEAA